VIGEAPHLVARHVDIGRERFVFAAQIVGGVAQDVGNAAEAVRGTVLLFVDT
jgi:hypothetical protein